MNDKTELINDLIRSCDDLIEYCYHSLFLKTSDMDALSRIRIRLEAELQENTKTP